MRGYMQLPREQRYQIQALLKTDRKQTQIARVVGVQKTTISREFRRNRGHRGYRPHQAHCRAQARQGTKRRPRLTRTMWQQGEALIRQAWSPEQIHGCLQHEHGQTIRHEWIYQYMYQDTGLAVICIGPCVARKGGEPAMAPIVDGDVSPSKSRWLCVRR